MRAFKHRYILILIPLIGLLDACKQKNLIAQNFPVPNESWSYSQPIDTTFVINDTNISYDLVFNLRNTNNYLYQNIFILHCFSPIGDSTKHPLTRNEFKLADIDGKWLGNGSGAIYDNKFILKKNFKFPQKGTYHIHIEQNMRDNPLKGISDIGFSVESSKP